MSDYEDEETTQSEDVEKTITEYYETLKRRQEEIDNQNDDKKRRRRRRLHQSQISNATVTNQSNITTPITHNSPSIREPAKPNPIPEPTDEPDTSISTSFPEEVKIMINEDENTGWETSTLYEEPEPSINDHRTSDLLTIDG